MAGLFIVLCLTFPGITQKANKTPGKAPAKGVYALQGPGGMIPIRSLGAVSRRKARSH